LGSTVKPSFRFIETKNCVSSINLGLWADYDGNGLKKERS